MRAIQGVRGLGGKYGVGERIWGGVRGGVVVVAIIVTTMEMVPRILVHARAWTGGEMGVGWEWGRVWGLVEMQ